MYCPYCGAWNPEESKFCGKCGQRLQTKGQPRQGTKGGLCLLLAVLAIFLFLAILALGTFFLREHLFHIWQTFVAQPTATLVPPTLTVLPTEVPVQAAETLTPSPSPVPTVTETFTPIATPTATVKPTPPQRSFKLVYKNCIPHALSVGSVKGQVFDRAGKAIPGAKVRITINGYEWQSDANPATTNVDGWYEWYLEPGQKVKFVELIVDGKTVAFAPRDLEVIATSGCFQRVDFIEQ